MPTATNQQAPPQVLSLRNGSNATPRAGSEESPPSSPSSDHTDSPPVDPLREQIISNLTGTDELTIPGSIEEDRAFGFRRRIPTMVLYSEKGLQIYERITQTKAYYPFEAEKEILEKFGDEIACRMFGLPTSILLEQEQKQKHSNGETGSGNGVAKKERWGDASVGLHNYGVNGGLSDSGAIQIATSGLAVELGSGSLDKTRHLLRSMAKLLQPRSKSSPSGIMNDIEYKALDLEAASLYSTLSSLASIEGESVTTSLQDHIPTRRVSVSGLHATYDEGLAFLKEQNSRPRRPSDPLVSPDIKPTISLDRLPDTIDEESDASSSPPLAPVPDLEEEKEEQRKTSILWLGSSIGNFTREEAVDFLKGIHLAEGDTMLIGVDGCDNGPEIEVAYNDPEGVTRDFILEGVDVAGRTLHPDLPADQGLCSTNFEYANRWNATLGRHEAYVRAKKDVSIPIPAIPGSKHQESELTIEKGELLQIEVSYKYTRAEALSLFHLAGLRLIQTWTDSSQRHSLYLVEKPFVFFPSLTAAEHLGIESNSTVEKNDCGVPALEEWEEMFRAWDWLMHEIIPPSLRFTKPIPLRHVPLFYIGHAPAFRDIHLSRYFKEPLTSPAHFAEIFERGIDPDVQDQTKIGHWHSEVPQTDEDWPKFEEIVEYEERVRERVRKVYEEHDGKWDRKMARVLMMVFEHEMMHFETSVYICLQACTSLNLPLGTALPDFPSLSRFESRRLAFERSKLGEDARKRVVSFDKTTVDIGQDDLEADDEKTPYDSNHRYGWDCENPKRSVEIASFKISALPITNGEYLEWISSVSSGDDRTKLVPSSWVEREGGYIAVKTLWGEVEMEYAQEWPIAASSDQLEKFAQNKGGRLPTQAELSCFLAANPSDHPLSNLGLSNLHAVPPTLPSPARDGSQIPASNGGLWEWTSSTLSPWEGFAGSKLYPGYSSDFHDEKHRIVLGASWASPRRIARRSFVNFYQGAYPYALIGARVAFDV